MLSDLGPKWDPAVRGAGTQGVFGDTFGVSVSTNGSLCQFVGDPKINPYPRGFCTVCVQFGGGRPRGMGFSSEIWIRASP